MLSHTSRKVFRTELTPLSFLRRSALLYPGGIAVVHQDRRYTYAQMLERVQRFASRLRMMGFGARISRK